jgi:DNA-binding MarR family transcriptional regulator
MSDDIHVEALIAQGQHSLSRLMLQICRQFNAIAAQRYAARGHGGLTPVHTYLLANLGDDALRIGTLADRMKTTKQFTGRLVAELESRGYIETRPDPADRRATLVKTTATGWRFFQEACDIKTEIEGEYSAVIGVDAMAVLSKALEQLADYNPHGAEIDVSDGGELGA